MDTRRLYLNSKDTDLPYVQNHGLHVSVKEANIMCLPDQNLAVSLVRAEFPTTLEAVARTTKIGNIPAKNISLLTYSFNSVPHRLYFNDYKNINGALANHTNMLWTIQTKIDNIVEKINTDLAAPVLEYFTEESSSNRLMSNASISFDYTQSSKKVLIALGLYTDKNTTIDSLNPAPYQYNLGSALPVLYIVSNLSTTSFTSKNGGNIQNILASIPLTIDSQITGYKLLASSVGGAPENGIVLPAGVNYINHANAGAHKPISQRYIGDIELLLQNDEGIEIGTGQNNWSVTIEVKTVSAVY
jgi:hypothetical protein